MALQPAALCPLSTEYVLDNNGRVVVGATLRAYEAGTLNPVVLFADAELSEPLQQPVSTTGRGRFPAIYIGTGYFRYRTFDQNGVVLDDLDGLQGAVVTSVTNNITDTGSQTPTAALQPYYGTEVPGGWVRANGRTIGNAVSGGTELADPTTQPLFVSLWISDPNLAVTGGRGNTAISDFNAGKQIALPDLRRRALIGLDGMGNGLVNGAPWATANVALTTLGAFLGEESHTLSIGEMPTHSHIMACDVEGGHIHDASCDIQGTHSHGATADQQGVHTHSAGMDTQGDHNHAATVDAQGDHTHGIYCQGSGTHQHNYTYYRYNRDGLAPNGSSTGGFSNRDSENLNSGQTDSQGLHQHEIDIYNAGSHVHNVTIQNSGAHVHNITVQNNGQHSHNIAVIAAGAHQHNIGIADAGEHTHIVTAQPVGGSAAHNNVQPSMPVTILIKL